MTQRKGEGVKKKRCHQVFLSVAKQRQMLRNKTTLNIGSSGKRIQIVQHDREGYASAVMNIPITKAGINRWIRALNMMKEPPK